MDRGIDGITTVRKPKRIGHKSFAEVGLNKDNPLLMRGNWHGRTEVLVYTLLDQVYSLSILGSSAEKFRATFRFKPSDGMVVKAKFEDLSAVRSLDKRERMR